jgi:endonuclease/exonuclease/phosphatase family metal-dependent hydrolase
MADRTDPGRPALNAVRVTAVRVTAVLVTALAVALAAVVACAPATGTTAREAGVGPATPGPATATTPDPTTVDRPLASVRVLQLNLCSSGIAACYTGRSTDRAVAVVRAEAPDLITLNEVCQDDVTALERALADVVPGGTVVSAFQPARDGRTGEPYRCRNGRQYGIGLVSRWPSAPGSAPDGGIYPDQDRDDPEERAWLCLDAAADSPVTVCTTHLAYTKREIAGAQCRYLFETVIGDLRARDGAAPAVVGADLNLGSGDSPDLKACLPPGSALVDDGGPQHVVATPEYVVGEHRTVDLRGTTDHPGLLVTLTPAGS